MPDAKKKQQHVALREKTPASVAHTDALLVFPFHKLFIPGGFNKLRM
jgi:hypothetical protein